MPPVVEATIAIELPALIGHGTGTSRVNLSVLHLLSAASFSRAAASIEEANAGRLFGEFWEGILAQSTATVLISVAALEAYANELFVDHAKIFPDLRIEVMAHLWELYEQKPPLEKYEFAILLKKGQPLERGTSPYRDVAALVKLRNALTHFKPEWEDQQVQHAKVSSLLKGKFISSPFMPSTEALFPKAWASHGCTSWAVRSVVDFIFEFERRADLPSRLSPFVERLNAL